MHSHDGTQKKSLTSAQIYSRYNREQRTRHLVRGLQPPPPGRTISLVGTQLSDPTHIYNTKKQLRPLLRSTRSHALPGVGAAASTVDRRTRRTRPAHKDHQKLPHRPKVTRHRPQAQHRAIWQPSPTVHHRRNQPIPRQTEQERAPSNYTSPPLLHPLTARCKRPPRCEPRRRHLHPTHWIPAGRRNNMDSEQPNPGPHGIRTMEPHPKIYPIRGGQATTQTAKLENGPLPQRSHDHTVAIDRRSLPCHGHAAPLRTPSKLGPTCSALISKTHFRPGGMAPSEWTLSVRAVRDTPVADYSAPGVNTTRRVAYRPPIAVSQFLLALSVSYFKQTLWHCGQL